MSTTPTRAIIAIAFQSLPPALPGDYVDNLSFHLMYRLAYRNFGGNPVRYLSWVMSRLWEATANPTMERFAGTNSGTRGTRPRLRPFSDDTYDPDKTYRWMGSIAMDKDHNIALGYSKSSPTVIPSIFITGRLSTDPMNTLGAESRV